MPSVLGKISLSVPYLCQKSLGPSLKFLKNLPSIPYKPSLIKDTTVGVPLGLKGKNREESSLNTSPTNTMTLKRGWWEDFKYFRLIFIILAENIHNGANDDE